jgi:hypothetical protein
MPVGGVTTAGCKRQAWHSSVRSSSIQRDERDAPRSAQEPQQLETIDVVWHEDQIYVPGTFNRRLCMYRLLAIFHPSRFWLDDVRNCARARNVTQPHGMQMHCNTRSRPFAL